MLTLRLALGAGHNTIAEGYVFDHPAYVVTPNITARTLDELPKDIQHKLAVLLCMDPKPPNEEIPGVGMRVSENTFWIYLHEEQSLALQTIKETDNETT